MACIGEDCGIGYKRLASWLEDELALPKNGSAWVFFCNRDGTACRVRIDPLPERTVAGLKLPRTYLTAEGGESAVEEFHRLFTLRFISAGG